MKWTEIPSGQTHRVFNTLMTAFGDRADVIVDKVISDEGIANRIALLCLNRGFEPSTSQTRARKIMGKNYFGVEEAMKHFDVAPTKRQLACMSEVPYFEGTLVECKDSHILTAYFRNPIVDIRARTARIKLPDGQNRLFCIQDWYNNQPFASGNGQFDWYLIRKTPVPDSIWKSWSAQQALLNPKIEETPEARVMAYTIVGHFLNTGERLFEKVYVRCVDLDSGGFRVYLGNFAADGLGIRNRSDGGCDDNLAVASSRKQEF